jgi:hypothetical protein
MMCAAPAPGLPRRSWLDVRLPDGEKCWLLAVLVCQWFAFSYLMIKHHVLINDTAGFASYYLDMWRSLHQDGSIAWWWPGAEGGFPSYIYAAIGDINGKAPHFVFCSLIFYVAGLLHLKITSFMWCYTVYFSLIIPFCFTLAAYYAARQLLFTAWSRIYVVIAAAFSPAVFFSLTDIGLSEPAIYLLVLVGASAAFLRKPSPASFWLFVVAVAALGLAGGYTALISTAFLLAALFFSVILTRDSRQLLVAALRVPSTLEWIVALVVVLSSLLPGAVAVLDSRVLNRAGDGLYFSDLLRHFPPGNPLEILFASVPFVNMNWIHDEFVPIPLPTRAVSYEYINLMVVPLAIIGLLYGRRPYRIPLLLLAFVLPMVVVLNNGSPFTGMLLSLPSPFQSMRHLGDAYMRSGGFFPLIFAGAFGVEALALNYSQARRIAPWLVMAMTIIAIATSVANSANHAMFTGIPVGLLLTLGICMTISLIWLRDPEMPSAVKILLVLALVDGSTFAYWHVSRYLVLQFQEGKADTLPIDHHVKGLIQSKQKSGLIQRGVDLKQLPAPRLFYAVRSVAEVTPADFQSANQPSGSSLAVSADGAGELGSELSTQSPGESGNGSVTAIDSGANRQEYRVVSPRPAVLFVPTLDIKGWRATVNGHSERIVNALGAFMAVPVPAGPSIVTMEFQPRAFAAGLAFAYLSFMIAIGLALGVRVELASAIGRLGGWSRYLRRP